MSKPRTLTPNKEMLLKAVHANPGLSVSQLVNLTGVPQWAAQKILPELAGQRLVHFRMDQPNKHRLKRWYPLASLEQFVANGFKNESVFHAANR